MYFYCKRVDSFKQKLITVISIIFAILLVGFVFRMPVTVTSSQHNSLHSLSAGKKGYEVFGFAPYWTLSNMQNVDFNILTTFAYFGIPVSANGLLDTTDPGYSGFESQQATDLFTKAHSNGTRVVLTITQMDASTIATFLSDTRAQQTAIDQTVSLVKQRGIDGVNIDMEYIGDPGQQDRDAFSAFVGNLTKNMHKNLPSSKVTVSVIATAAKNPTLYDLSSLSKNSDGIFMMAYDFANLSSDNAMPTSPLYGYKDGKYWYDVSTAVSDFLTQMPADKLILGVPWYTYNYAVPQPGSDAPTYSWTGSAFVQTYATASANTINAQGWDADGQVGWRAYYIPQTDTWRMTYVEDSRSLGIKYDFAKKENLAGVGVWALGFDNGTNDMWNVLQDKFGVKYADASVMDRQIISYNN